MSSREFPYLQVPEEVSRKYIAATEAPRAIAGNTDFREEWDLYRHWDAK